MITPETYSQSYTPPPKVALKVIRGPLIRRTYSQLGPYSQKL